MPKKTDKEIARTERERGEHRGREREGHERGEHRGHERAGRATSRQVYPNFSTPKGLCIIFNNYKFKPKPREGTNLDEASLQRLFESFNYNVVVKRDLWAAEVAYYSSASNKLKPMINFNGSNGRSWTKDAIEQSERCNSPVSVGSDKIKWEELDGEDCRREKKKKRQQNSSAAKFARLTVASSAYSHMARRIVYGTDDEPINLHEFKDLINGENAHRLIGKAKLTEKRLAPALRNRPGPSTTINVTTNAGFLKGHCARVSNRGEIPEQGRRLIKKGEREEQFCGQFAETNGAVRDQLGGGWWRSGPGSIWARKKSILARFLHTPVSQKFISPGPKHEF
uniref:CASPASE_P20 domain-containing protein n=1 Tax=Globodera pallida TaxID=36090 RepID=A0A183CJY3_GLOPA